VNGSLVADLGVGPEVWLYLSLLGCVTFYFKFGRIWSVRNLDLLLLFAPAPGLMMLVGNGGGGKQPWFAFLLLFAGSGSWLVRCLVDLGLTRRPMLEPNLNAAGLGCLATGILVLLVIETVNLPVSKGAARNPADTGSHAAPPPPALLDEHGPVKQVLSITPLPRALRTKLPEVILSRVLACLAHLALVFCLIAVGWWHYDRWTTGLAMATCYLISPYTRIALVDSGQLVPAALTVAAVAFYNRPTLAGALIGLAAGLMPACVGLLPLWGGFYRRRGGVRFAAVGFSVLAACALLALVVPDLAVWARALGAHGLADAGLLPGSEAGSTGSFWSGLEPAYRLPVIIAYLALVSVTTIWPAEKNLGELIALSAALLVASQFWYLEEGGTLVVLYLPLFILLMFRPNLAAKRAAVDLHRARPTREPLVAGR